jgi:hypothetical protein
MFEKMMEDWMKFQQKMMPDMPNHTEAFKGIKNAAETFSGIQNPMTGDIEKWTKFMENSIKFQRAYITQQQAMLEMMEAMTDNAKILSNK